MEKEGEGKAEFIVQKKREGRKFYFLPMPHYAPNNGFSSHTTCLLASSSFVSQTLSLVVAPVTGTNKIARQHYFFQPLKLLFLLGKKSLDERVKKPRGCWLRSLLSPKSNWHENSNDYLSASQPFLLGVPTSSVSSRLSRLSLVRTLTPKTKKEEGEKSPRRRM